MAQLEELEDKFLNQEKERMLGRYWATDIYRIEKKYLTPSNFFNPPKIDKKSFGIILLGMAIEKFLDHILTEEKADYIHNPTYETKINDEITLVVQPDFVFPAIVWEVKCPVNKPDAIPAKWEYQLECEYRTTHLPISLAVWEYPFNFTFYSFTPDDKRWQKIQKILIDFHNKLKTKI